jgi:hypothetical protein
VQPITVAIFSDLRQFGVQRYFVQGLLAGSVK